MVLGEKPQGANIVKRGKGSAFATAQVTHGEPPKKVIRVDSGLEDIAVSAMGKKRIRLVYTPDPKGRTKGDITIGRKAPKPPRPSSGLRSVKKGKLYHTKVKGSSGTLISRRPLGRKRRR